MFSLGKYELPVCLNFCYWVSRFTNVHKLCVAETLTQLQAKSLVLFENLLYLVNYLQDTT